MDHGVVVVPARGNERKKIFLNDRDREIFERQKEKKIEKI